MSAGCPSDTQLEQNKTIQRLEHGTAGINGSTKKNQLLISLLVSVDVKHHVYLLTELVAVDGETGMGVVGRGGGGGTVLRKPQALV